MSALPQPTKTTTIALTVAISFGEQQISHLELREPTIGDLMQVDDFLDCAKNPYRLIFELASIVTSIPVKVLGRLSLDDAKAVAKFLGPFAVAFLSIGLT